MPDKTYKLIELVGVSEESVHQTRWSRRPRAPECAGMIRNAPESVTNVAQSMV